MPTFSISDITPAGAYVNAVSAAQDSDRRNADRRAVSGGGRNLTKHLTSLVRLIAAASTENRPSASQPAPRSI